MKMTFNRSIAKPRTHRDRRDRIDIELSKVYFPDHSGKKRIRKRVLLAVGSALAFVALLVSLFFARFSLDLRILPAVTKAKMPLSGPAAYSKGDSVIFDFKRGSRGWEIPQWALDKSDNAARSCIPIRNRSFGCLALDTDFPKDKWSMAVVEVQRYIDISGYDAISTDIFIPKDAPAKLKAKIILTTGENWQWVEMAGSVSLVPGEWTRVSASIAIGSMDWKRMRVRKGFSEDIRKVAVRVEGDHVPYEGPVFIGSVAAVRH